MPDPKKNVAFTFDLSLVDSANRPQFKVNPTLETGDFKISTDEGALVPLATLPAVSPAGSRNVKVVLNTSEMNGDRMLFQAVDAAGAEWDEVIVEINTTEVTVDDLVRSTTPANALDVSATGEAGLDFSNIKDAAGAHTLTNITVPTVTSVTNGVTVTTNNDKTGYGLSASAIQAIWDALTSALTTVGSIGKLLVDNINATISSRLASASYTAPLDAAGVRTAVGLASANLDTQLATIAAYIDTEVAAIKAKTDQLTFTSATKVDATLQAGADLATAVGQKVADIVLRRVAANIEVSANGDTLDEASLYGLIQRASKSDTTTHTGKHTIFKSDGSTEVAQVPIATGSAADIVGVGA